MATYPNGLIPLSELKGVPAANGQTAWLYADAANSLLRVMDKIQAKHGWSPLVTSAGDGFRSLERQVNVFRSRYRDRYSTVTQGGRQIVDRRVWNGVPYWRWTGAAAAIPGTSNHGKGKTADLTGLGKLDSPRYNEAEAILVAEGWSNKEGRSISEPWHWNYTRGATQVDNTNELPGVSITTPTGKLPTPLVPEDDMFNDVNAKDLSELLRLTQLHVLAPSGRAQPRTAEEVAFVESEKAMIENRRMIGVILGYNPPANDTERAALALLRGESDDEDDKEQRRMLGVLLGWETPVGPEQQALADLRARAESDPAAAAEVAAEIGRRLSKP